MKMTLKTARVASGFTQEQVAKILDVTSASLCHWERGNRTPKVTTFFQLCELYKVKPTDIILPKMSGQN